MATRSDDPEGARAMCEYLLQGLEECRRIERTLTPEELRQRRLASIPPAACWSWPVTAEHRAQAAQVAKCADPEEAWQLGMRLLEDWQDGRCAMCPARASDTDHDHKTGLVRGLLCHSCNLCEGHASDPEDPYVQYRSRNPATILGIQVRYYSPFTGWAQSAPPPRPLSEHPAYILATRYGARGNP